MKQCLRRLRRVPDPGTSGTARIAAAARPTAEGRQLNALRSSRRALLSRLAAIAIGAVGLNVAAPFVRTRDEHVPRRNPSLNTATTADGVLVFTHDVTRRKIGTHLEPLGAVIWEHVDGIATSGEIVSQVRARLRPQPPSRLLVEDHLRAMGDAGLLYFGAPVWELIRYR
jgi:hypothetical protein